MNHDGPLPGRAPALLARLGLASAVFAVLLLPALVAGLALGSPAGPDELTRLGAAIRGETGSFFADAFVAATAAGDLAPADGIARARLGQLAAWFVVAALVYVAGCLARGRLLGIAACAVLALLPPVTTAGPLLRAEVWATAFTLLGLVLCQCLVGGGRRRRVQIPLAVCAALAIGLATAAVPTLGTALLVPTVPFLLIALQAMLRAVRIGARRRFLAVPARAITARLSGPALAALLAPVAALVLMVDGVQGQGPASTAIPASLLPPGHLPNAAVIGFGVFGGLAFLLGAGVRFGRGGRIGGDLVLASYCATQLLHPQFAGGRDPTPAAPAIALLVAHGVLTATAAAVWWRRRRVSGGRPG